MNKNIPEALRRAVAERALHRCEYCRRPEIDAFIRYQSDHIISRKHRGKTTLNNLAHACPICNNAKGSDLATVLEEEGQLIRLFHPRKDDWFAHFYVSNPSQNGHRRSHHQLVEIKRCEPYIGTSGFDRSGFVSVDTPQYKTHF